MIHIGMDGHEVPTVFVHGQAPADSVEHAEAQLHRVRAGGGSVGYSMLNIEADGPLCAVEAEVRVGTRTIGARGSGPTVRVATDRCMEELAAALARVTVEVLR